MRCAIGLVGTVFFPARAGSEFVVYPIVQSLFIFFATGIGLPGAGRNRFSWADSGNIIRAKLGQEKLVEFYCRQFSDQRVICRGALFLPSTDMGIKRIDSIVSVRFFPRPIP